MFFIELTNTDGRSYWINAEHIVRIKHADSESHTGSQLELIDDWTVHSKESPNEILRLIPI